MGFMDKRADFGAVNARNVESGGPGPRREKFERKRE